MRLRYVYMVLLLLLLVPIFVAHELRAPALELPFRWDQYATFTGSMAIEARYGPAEAGKSGPKPAGSATILQLNKLIDVESRFGWLGHTITDRAIY